MEDDEQKDACIFSRNEVGRDFTMRLYKGKAAQFDHVANYFFDFLCQIVGVNFYKEFIYTSNCNLDLRESKRNNRQDLDFTWKLSLRKTTEEEKNSLFSEDYNELFREQLSSSN